MAKSSFTVTNNLAKFISEAESKADEALMETGEEILAEIKANAPRKTGELADSYEMQIIGENEIEIGSPLERALPAEFGTSTRSARPHVIPAVVKSEKILERKLKEKYK